MKVQRWLTVALDSGVFWPTTEIAISYDGHEFLLLPETEELAPRVATAYDPPMDDSGALLLIRRFLSTLAWVEHGYLRETFTLGTGGGPGRLSKSPGARLINPSFKTDYLPTVGDDRSRLCLALYREALNLNSAPFQFLGFYKIINVLHDRGPDQKAWINSKIGTIKDYDAMSRIRELKGSHTDLGTYLYESGRCAVAHTFQQPIVDPDDPADTKRLFQDLPVIKALAEIVIEHEFGVKSLRTYRREHLYQLDGFRQLFGAPTVSKLKSLANIDPNVFPSLPTLSIRVRHYEKYSSFDSMEAEIRAVENGCVWVRCSGQKGIVTVFFGLDFPSESLAFDLQHHVLIRDDGSPLATQCLLDDNRFFQDLITNGELEIWDSDKDALLGRADPLIPMNIDTGATVRNLKQRREILEAQLAARTVPE